MRSFATWSRISTRPSSSPRSSRHSDGDISMKAQIAGLMKQAQQMQENMRKLQDGLASVEVEGQSGAGMAKVTMTCRHDVKRVHIDPSLLADDKDMLEDLVAAAINDAARKVEPAVQEKMSPLPTPPPPPPPLNPPFFPQTTN